MKTERRSRFTTRSYSSSTLYSMKTEITLQLSQTSQHSRTNVKLWSSCRFSKWSESSLMFKVKATMNMIKTNRFMLQPLPLSEPNSTCTGLHVTAQASSDSTCMSVLWKAHKFKSTCIRSRPLSHFPYQTFHFVHDV